MPTSFFEPQFFNNEAAGLIISGTLKTPREYYFKFGQFDPTGRPVTFVGTPGNDILTGVGVGKVELMGVEVGAANGLRRYESDGTNEFDTLTRGSGSEKFVLGDFWLGTTGGAFSPQQFYIGPGFATIRNFTQGHDSIQLRGTSLEQLLVFPINNNRDLAIQTNGLPVVGQNGVPETSRLTHLLLLKAAAISVWIYYQTLVFLELYLDRNIEAIQNFFWDAGECDRTFNKMGDRTFVLALKIIKQA